MDYIYIVEYYDEPDQCWYRISETTKRAAMATADSLQNSGQSRSIDVKRLEVGTYLHICDSLFNYNSGAYARKLDKRKESK